MARKTRQQLWDDAVAAATGSVQDLIDIQDECREELDEMSSASREDERGQKLTQICDIDFQNIVDTLQDASDQEIPK
jgi:GTP cyclohydrolase III